MRAIPCEKPSPPMYQHSPSRKNGRAWMLFDWAAQPYFTLLATFIFPPFFVDQLVGDAIEGQALWGMTSAGAALLVGLIAPLAGSYADRTGRTSPYFFSACLLGMIGALGFWFCKPGLSYAVPLAIVATLVTALGFEIATSLNNAMIRHVTSHEKAAELAWKGWALGGASGTLVLLIFIAFIFPADGNRTLLGLTPLIEFADPQSGPPRFTGPFTALWFFIFLMPIVIFYKDMEPKTAPPHTQTKPKTKIITRKSLRFLAANLILSDALLAMFVFGGLYASAVFQWGAEKLALLGIALTLAGLVGVMMGLWLNKHIDVRQIALGACTLIVVGGIFILGLDPEWLWWQPAQAWNAYLSTSELAFIITALIIGGSTALLQSALRVMFLAHAQPDQMGRSFGFFALSGKATSFMGPLLVSFAISYFASTKAGMAVILIMIACGAIFLIGNPARNTSASTQN